MRRAAQLKQPPGYRSRLSESISLPAPIGGWNARDSIAIMEPTDALKMENWWPSAEDIQVRKGWADHVTGIGEQVESLMAYNEADGTQTLFAAADDSFYDVTSSGSVGAAVQGSLSNARWQHVNFTNSSGTAYLCAFNGVDKPRYWDGSNWVSVDSGSSPAITGVTSTLLDNPWIHKRRLWVVETSSLSAWYLPVDAVGGAASEFDLAGLFKHGGYLLAGGTWTIDAGEGLDDYCIFITSEGEVAVYQGTDPSSGTTWAIVGVWKIGEPIGKRCLMKYAGDLLAICRDGVLPLSLALQSSQVNPRTAITDKIRNAITTATMNSGSNFGWQLLFYPGAQMILLNVPVSESQDQEQYAMNTITGSWGRFQDIEANCWAILDQEPYFGGDGFVAKFWSVYDDNDTEINADLQQAFSYFGDRSGLKHWKMLRPIIKSEEDPGLLVGLNVDYEDTEPSGSISFSIPAYGLWDAAVWDTDVWGGGLLILKNWQSVSAYGTCAALRMKIQTGEIEVRFEAADYVFERGEVI